VDLFEVKQSKEEIKQFLCRFNEVVVQILQVNEGMFVEAFIRGLRARTFGDTKKTTRHGGYQP